MVLALGDTEKWLSNAAIPANDCICPRRSPAKQNTAYKIIDCAKKEISFYYYRLLCELYFLLTVLHCVPNYILVGRKFKSILLTVEEFHRQILDKYHIISKYSS